MVAAFVMAVVLAACGVAERAAQPAEDYKKANWESGTFTVNVLKNGTCVFTFHPTYKKGVTRPKAGFKSRQYTEKKPLMGNHHICMVAKNPGSKFWKTTGWHLVGKPYSYKINPDHKTTLNYINIKHVVDKYAGNFRVKCAVYWKAYSSAYTEKTPWPDYKPSYFQRSKCKGAEAAAKAYQAQAKGRYSPTPLMTTVMARWTEPRAIGF
jgi:hypothetical protein